MVTKQRDRRKDHKKEENKSIRTAVGAGGHGVGFIEKVKGKQGSEDLAKHVSERRQPWRWEQVFQAQGGQRKLRLGCC